MNGSFIIASRPLILYCFISYLLAILTTISIGLDYKNLLFFIHLNLNNDFQLIITLLIIDKIKIFYILKFIIPTIQLIELIMNRKFKK